MRAQLLGVFIGVGVGVAVAAATALPARPGDDASAGLDPVAPPGRPYLFTPADWSYIWGASPEDPAAPDGLLYAHTRREVDAWNPAPDPFIIQKEAGDRDLWLRIRVPHNPEGWKDAAIHFSNFGGLMVLYYNDRRIYARGNMETRKDDYLALHHTLYRLGAIEPAGAGQGPGDAGHVPAGAGQGHNYFVMHYLSNAAVEIEVNLSEGGVWFGERFDLLIQMLRKDIALLILGVLFLIAGLVALSAYLRRRTGDARLYAGFSLFAISSGVTTFITTDLMQLLWPQPQIFWDWTGMLSFILLPVGILLFYEQVFGSGWRNIVRRLWQYHLVLGGAMTLTVLLLYQQIDVLITSLIVTITVLILVFWTSVALVLLLLVALTFRRALRGSLQAWLFFAGTLVLTLAAVPDFIQGFSGDGGPESDSYYHWGRLPFMVLLSYVADQHFA